MKFGLFLSLLLMATSSHAVYEDFDIDNSTLADAQYVGNLLDDWDIHVFGARGEVTQFGTTITDNNNADFYSFDVDRSATINITVLTPAGPGGINDPIVGLFSEFGDELAIDDDSHQIGAGLDSILTYHLADAGTYVFAVAGFDFGDFDDFNSDEGDTDFLYAVEVTTTVPVPAAVWLFGSALIGFVGLGRRRIA